MIREIIIARRKELGFTQKYVAKLSGIRTATISTFENDKSNLSSNLLEKVMEVLNLTIFKLPDSGKSARAKEK